MEDNRKKNYSQPGDGDEAENHQRGRELYQRDQQRHQHNPQQQHRPENRHWNSDHNNQHGQHNQHNQHQGRFPEDQYERNSNADRGASLSKHYGEREHSSYRNSNSLNYGDGRGNSTHQSGQQGGGTFAGSNQDNQRTSHQYNQHNQHQHHNQHNQLNRNQHNQHNNSNYSSHGDGRGNYSARQDSYGQGHDNVHSDNRISEQRRRDDSNENYYKGAYMDSRGVKNELPRPDDNPYNEYPGSRSRYKDDDYRFGSGNHTWYEEQRYTDNNGHRQDRDKGDITGEMGEGVRDAWNTMKHGVQNLFGRNSDHHDDHNRHDNRRNDHEYRAREDRGTERGPRWSDETDSGDDNNSRYNRDNNPRYY
ncbi:hypothetical protein [Rufibacter tibetensis]|uniref:Uncharacterized protein n=1 Tax=Rufibacter tibetensis TaxID=512763 RepID=A0A0N7HW83_9BACT|nr:hypothetical protein [Rufibacter tibetensis]ALI98528.1 hypothetical protein DC20_05515 [Rufibacter tibetensis]